MAVICRFDDERTNEIVDAICKWLAVRYRFDRDELLSRLDGPEGLAADIDHSALLGRLLDGKEPLPEPPPVCYAYPVYALAEGEACTIGGGGPIESERYAGKFNLGRAPWEIVEKIDERTYRIRWPGQAAVYRAEMVRDPHYTNSDEKDWRVQKEPGL